MNTIIIVALLASVAFARSPINPKVAEEASQGSRGIIGGNQAEYGEYPWMVSLQMNNHGHYCGGSIIAPLWILTAGHCVEGITNDRVVIGEYDVLNFEWREKIHHVEKEFLHEEYYTYPDFGGSPINDIALLKLTEPVEYTDVARPIPLPKFQQEFTGEATLSGWGAMSMEGPVQQFLQEVTYPILDDDTCRKHYGDKVIIDSVMCAGDQKPGRSACPGDSGGPLTCLDEEGKRFQCGVTSWVVDKECGQTEYPNVYTQLSYFVDWVKDKMENN